MADPLARNDWIGTREDRWTDVLPQSWQSAINTNPVVNALARYMQPRQSFDQYAREWQDNIPGNSPIDRIAEGRSTIAKEYPSPMNPLAADILEKGGFLANFLSPGAPKLPTPAAPKPQGIKAYHGSPHDFDRFDISKIGTGEGNQAYGHGLYFAEAEGTAKQYRDVLERATAWKKPYAHAQSALRTVDAELNQIDQDGLFGRLSRRSERAALEKKQQQLRAEVARYEAELSDPDKRGKMYEVRINADPEKFVDWDKPLSQQPEAVRALYDDAMRPKLKQRPIGDNPHHGPLTDVMFDGGGSIGVFTKDKLADALANPSKYVPTTGKDFHDDLARRLVNGDWGKPGEFAQQQASQALRDAGIPGIKYKDAMSRDGGGPGTSNYVVFDDKLIEILRKYGLLPPVAAGAAQVATQGQDQQF